MRFTNFLLVLVPLFFLMACPSSSQNVFVTPSGKKYHRATCRHVDNTYASLPSTAEAEKRGYTACKHCNPSATKPDNLQEILDKKSSYQIDNIDVEVLLEYSTQCLGYTKLGLRCLHKTRNTNKYCYQHLEQVPK